MTSFTRPFDPGVSFCTDVIIDLPEESLVRPGVARYAGAKLVMMHITAQNNTSFSLKSPVKGTARNISLPIPSPLQGGIDQLLEISPLPFGIAPVLRALRPGLPTFYLGYVRVTNIPEDDEVLDPAKPLANDVTGDAYIGLIFQDGISPAPWSWIKILRDAMANAGEDVASWDELISLVVPDDLRSLRVIDHIGRPVADQTFQIRIRRTDGVFEGPWTRKTAPDGDLEKSVTIDPLIRDSGHHQYSLFGGSGESTELIWIGDAPRDDISLPVYSIYETGLSSAPGEPLILPAETKRAHLQILELTRWLASRTPGTSADMARYHIGSRVEPIVDGKATFKLLVDDLLASASPGYGAHFTGYAFKEFPLDDGRKDETGADIDTSINALAKRISDRNGGTRFLISKFINWKTDPDSDFTRAAAIAVLAAGSALTIISLTGAVSTNSVGFYIILGGSLLGSAYILTLFNPSSHIEELAEYSLDIFPKLNSISNSIALWTRYPARLVDNPIATSLPFNLDTYQDQFGAWHQKIQLIRRPADAQNNEFIAYLGGIDINGNRLDSPGHNGKAFPYHDVHARLTGPGAADVFKTWDEAYNFYRSPDSPDPVFSPPSPDSLSLKDAKHITQVGRTYFKPNPSGGTSPFPFALNGETTTNDTLIRAIKAARQYIYIEDQYFTPNSLEPLGSPEPLDSENTYDTTYFDAILSAGAADKCKRLIILLPATIDQPFGYFRRKKLFDELKEVWGERVLIGTPLRRPILSNPGRIASEGRCILMSNISEGDDTIVIGPRSRVPKNDYYWLWIDGELILSSSPSIPVTVDGVPCSQIHVLRGSSDNTNPRWGASVRNHKKGAPVTLSQLKGIYVHAKCMMIDDIFLSIGSTNINRRGLFHDGEINVFAIPEQMRAAEDNPALALRTALWSEHLGLPPSMGAPLLKDPISAFDLFRRSIYEGNRFMPFNALDINPDLGYPLVDWLLYQIFLAAGITITDALIPTIWNDASDPTSYSERRPIPGP